MGYSFRLTARVLLYAPSHRQDSTYHGLCYTSRGTLAGTRNSSMGPPHEGSIRRPIAPCANALTTELHLAPPFKLNCINTMKWVDNNDIARIHGFTQTYTYIQCLRIFIYLASYSETTLLLPYCNLNLIYILNNVLLIARAFKKIALVEINKMKYLTRVRKRKGALTRCYLQ